MIKNRETKNSFQINFEQFEGAKQLCLWRNRGTFRTANTLPNCMSTKKRKVDCVENTATTPAANKADIPGDAWFSPAGDEFVNIYNFLTSLKVRQLMWGSPMTSKDSHLWKLFGCMFNQFGICTPLEIRHQEYGVVTSPHTFSVFQLYQLQNHPDQVLVFTGHIDTQTMWEWRELYHAISNFALKIYFHNNLLWIPNELNSLVMDHAALTTCVTCDFSASFCQ